VGSAAGEDDFADEGTALVARLVFAGVDVVVELVEAADAVGVYVI